MNDGTNEGGDELAKRRGGKGRKGKKAAAGAAEPKAPRKPRKAKQLQVPGTERHERVPEIEAAADAYAEIRDARMELTKKEVAAREVLRAAMKAHGLMIYECDAEDLTVELIPAEGEKVKVKRREADEDDDLDPAGGDA